MHTSNRMTQKDLYGGDAEEDRDKQRTLMYVATDTINTARRVKVLRGLQIVDLAQLGINISVAILDRTGITQEDIDQIMASKNTAEIANLLKNILQYIK